jgi:putative flippase GtrA
VIQVTGEPIGSAVSGLGGMVCLNDLGVSSGAPASGRGAAPRQVALRPALARIARRLYELGLCVFYRGCRGVAAMGVDPAGTAAPRRALDHWRGWLPGFIYQTARYGAVGVAVTLLYSGLVIFFKETAGVAEPDLASLFAFVIAVPFSYLGHWGITFQRRHRFLEGWQRFVALNITSFIAVIAAMHLVTHVLDWDYRIGIAISCVVAPVINYIVLQLWVFSHRRAS